jgi:photosystem II stability/assembly factor-like uncharacterized protein
MLRGHPPRPAALLLVLLFLAARAAGSETWVSVGPPGGDVRSLAADPRDPRLVYLGSADGVLYRSEDAGGRWERPSPGFPRRGVSLDDLVVGADGTLFVGFWPLEGEEGGGVARSDDGGRTFRLLSGLAGEGVRALAMAPGDTRVLVAGTQSGVHRSEDAGASWRRISPEGHPEIRNVNSVAIDPRDDRVVYVGTWHLPWKTADTGASWRPVRSGMIADSDVMTLSFDRRDPDTVFATACTGIYRSRNGGGLWSRLRGIPAASRRTRAFAQDPSRPDTLYAGTTEGLWRSVDGSSSWGLLTARELVVNAVLPLPGGVVLLGGEGVGVLRSTDDGRTWAASNEGFSSRFVTRLLSTPGGRVLAGIGHDRRHGGVLSASPPFGAWAPLGPGLEGREVLSLAVAGEGQEEVVLAGTDDGVFLHSRRLGAWRRLSTVVGGLEVHPRVLHLAMAPPGLIAAATPRGLLVSRDGGETWERHLLGLAGQVSGVALSDREPVVLAAATPLGFFLSDDAGRRFVQVSGAVAGAPVRSLAFLPGGARVLFGTTPAGLLRSSDGGRNWTRAGGGLPLSDITGLAFGADGSVFASDFRQGGVYRSADGGLSWSLLPGEGLSGERVWALAVGAGPEGRLLAATAASGLRELRRAGSGAGDLAGSK